MAYGSGSLPYFDLNVSKNFCADAGYSFGSSVGFVMYVCFWTAELSFVVKGDSATPSGPNSFAVGLAAWTSLNTWTPLFWVMPPKNMQSAPADLIFVARVRKLAALVSMPSLPRTWRPWALAMLATCLAMPVP